MARRAVSIQAADSTFSGDIARPVSRAQVWLDRRTGPRDVDTWGRESGLELDSPTSWVFTIRRGKVTRAEGFLNRADALEAAGLQE